MITILTGLLASKWGKYALELVVVLGLVFGAYKWAESRGRSAQKDSDQQSQSKVIEQSRKEASDAKDALVKVSTDAAIAADARAQASQAQYAVLAGVLSNQQARSQAGTAQVGKLPDTELHADVVTKLAVRTPGDLTAGYLPKEERLIDDAVTQYPIFKEENATLTSEVSTKDAEAKAERDVADARLLTINTNVAYTALLEKDYKTLYNQHPPRYRSTVCLFLWSCGKKELK
jgi:hypothetical protein